MSLPYGVRFETRGIPSVVVPDSWCKRLIASVDQIAAVKGSILRILSALVSGLLVELESQVRSCVRPSLARSEARLPYRLRRGHIQAF